MQGLNAYGEKVINPVTGDVTKFHFTGDPVSNSGWLNYNLCDKRMLLSNGPINFAPGDTNKVYFAIFFETGDSRIEALENLRKSGYILKSMFRTDFKTTPPKVTTSVNYISENESEINFEVLDSPGSSIRAELYNYLGELEASFQLLYDDEGIFRHKWTTTPSAKPLYLNFDISNSIQHNGKYERIVDRIATSGPMEVTDVSIRDNFNNDGIANPSEHLVILPVIKNNGIFDVSSLRIHVTSNDPYVTVDNAIMDISGIASGQDISVVYNDTNYISCQIAENIPDNHSIKFIAEMYDNNQNKWNDAFSIEVKRIVENTQIIEAEHISGIADGTAGIRLVDYNSLKTGHTYEMTFVDRYPVEKFHLRDVTANAAVLYNQDLPDDFSHNIPITDGFKIFKHTLLYGTINRWSNFKHVEGTLGATTLAEDVVINGITYHAGSPRIIHPFRISYRDTYEAFTPHVAAPTSPDIMGHDFEVRVVGNGNGQVATAIDGKMTNWKVLGNYTTQFEVWDMETVGGPAQINFFWRDRDGNGLINARSPVAYDRLVLVNTPYDPNGTYSPNSENVTWYFSIYEDDGDLLDPGNDGSDQWTAGQAIRVYIPNVITAKDTFAFTINIPQTNIPDETMNTPDKFHLFQNYPNPFNPETTIKFHLPKTSDVTLKIYNISGQEIKTLVHKEFHSGNHSVKWDGTNNSGIKVSSGIYIYTIRTGTGFIQSKKMLLLK